MIQVVQSGQQHVIFNERGERSACAIPRERIAHIERVAKITGVTEQMSGGEGGGVGRGEGGIERMAAGEIHSLFTQVKHGGCPLCGHRVMTQPIGDEENYVACCRGLGLHASFGRLESNCMGNEQEESQTACYSALHYTAFRLMVVRNPQP